MWQRTAAQPIFVTGLDVHQFGFGARFPGFFQNTVGASTVRVCAVTIGKREKIIREQMVFVLAVGACGHGKPLIEHAKTGAGNHGHNAVKDLPSVKIFVKTLVQELTQQAPTL